MNQRDFLPFLAELAAVAAAETLPRFRRPVTVLSKAAAFDPVTEADRAAEAAMRSLIASRYPGHGVVGEELGEERADAPAVWVLDPIDGTRAFISGLPLWTTLIGLRVEGEPVLGAIAQPYLGELFLGGPGCGARVIGPGGAERALGVRACPELGEATLMTTDPALFRGPDHARFQALAGSARLVRYGADAYAFAMLAAGHVDLVVETGLKPWDIEGPRAVVEGAGGGVRALRPPGSDADLTLAASSPALAEEALKVFLG